MLKEILSALRGRDVLAEMITKLGEMLEAGEWMFEQASEVLMREIDWSSVSDPLYARDKQINEIERGIRERIITHLSVGHQEDLGACLVLMSVVKDAERIGDYCKNLFEVARFYQREYTRTEYAEPLAEIRAAVKPLFAASRQAFTEADSKGAYSILGQASTITKRCDQLIRQLLSVHDQIAPDEAVAYVLLSRFYKRVAAHLANIATSVVSPVPMLDYHGQELDQ